MVSERIKQGKVTNPMVDLRISSFETCQMSVNVPYSISNQIPDKLKPIFFESGLIANIYIYIYVCV